MGELWVDMPIPAHMQDASDEELLNRSIEIRMECSEHIRFEAGSGTNAKALNLSFQS